MPRRGHRRGVPVVLVRTPNGVHRRSRPLAVTDTRPARWWDRLSGVELARRLEQRGVGLVSCAALVKDRNGEMAARIIDRELGEE